MMFGLAKLKLFGIAALGVIIAIFTAKKVGESKGKRKEKAKQSERVVKNVKKVTKARNNLTPAKRKRLRDEFRDK